MEEYVAADGKKRRRRKKGGCGKVTKIGRRSVPEGVKKALGAIATGVAGALVYKNRDAIKEKMGMKKGGTVKKMQDGGITRKAAERKTAKGKGFISQPMGGKPTTTKDVYVPFTRAGRKDAKEKGRVSSKDMKASRPVKSYQMGGMTASMDPTCGPGRPCHKSNKKANNSRLKSAGVSRSVRKRMS